MKNPDYSESFHSATVNIIEAHLSELFPLSHQSLSIADLGPGFPDKSLPIAKFLKQNQVDLTYIPVDISETFLEIASFHIKPFAKETVPIHAKFSECTKKISPRHRRSKFYCMIGLTFMNFPPEEILPILRDIAAQGGTVLLASEILGFSKSADTVLSSYQTTQAKQLTFGPLAHLGVEEKSLSYTVEFKDSRIEMGFKFTEDPPPQLASIGIREGDQIVTAVSYRYTEKQLQNYLNMYFRKIDLFFSEDKGTVVAKCEV